MHVHTQARTHTCTYTHAHTHTCTYTHHVHTHARTHTSRTHITYTHMHVYTLVYRHYHSRDYSILFHPQTHCRCKYRSSDRGHAHTINSDRLGQPLRLQREQARQENGPPLYSRNSTDHEMGASPLAEACRIHTQFSGTGLKVVGVSSMHPQAGTRVLCILN